MIANADDPLVAWGASTAATVTWVSAGQPWKEDSWCCPQCGGPLDRKAEEENDWACRECTFRRPTPTWVLDDDAVIDPRGRRWVLDLQLPGRANRANAAIALATAEVFGLRSIGRCPGCAR